MLAAIAIAASRPRAPLMASAVSAQASALRDEITTLAPCSASRSAMARPIPREEPVTTATRPVKSKRLAKIPSPNGGMPFRRCGVGLAGAADGFLCSRPASLLRPPRQFSPRERLHHGHPIGAVVEAGDRGETFAAGLPKVGRVLDPGHFERLQT